MLIPRIVVSHIIELTKYYPIISLTGPRQSGKTTLLRFLFPDYEYVSLEDPKVRTFAIDDPTAFLEEYSGKTIFDEAQLVPHLFSYLQTIVDIKGQMGQYVLSGSQNFLLHKQITQSLAGRVGILRLFPLSYAELAGHIKEEKTLDEVIYRGFYPSLFDRGIPPHLFYPNYVDTYLKRDVQDLINPGNLTQFYKFLKLCAGHVGQVINYTTLSNSMGLNLPTIKNWLSILEQSYIIFQLSPFFKNYNKRVIKKSKLYFYDTGLVCNLLDMKSSKDVFSYYQRGALFENLVVSEIFKLDYHRGRRPHLYFWRDNHGDEMDLIRDSANLTKLLEIKSTKTLMSHHFKGINKFRRLLENEQTQFYLVQGGDEEMVRNNGVQVLSWRDLSKF